MCWWSGLGDLHAVFEQSMLWNRGTVALRVLMKQLWARKPISKMGKRTQSKEKTFKLWELRNVAVKWTISSFSKDTQQLTTQSYEAKMCISRNMWSTLNCLSLIQNLQSYFPPKCLSFLLLCIKPTQLIYMACSDFSLFILIVSSKLHWW